MDNDQSWVRAGIVTLIALLIIFTPQVIFVINSGANPASPVVPVPGTNQSGEVGVPLPVPGGNPATNPGEVLGASADTFDAVHLRLNSLRDQLNDLARRYEGYSDHSQLSAEMSDEMSRIMPTLVQIQNRLGELSPLLSQLSVQTSNGGGGLLLTHVEYL